MTVRVRFAPSPTGFLHVGGARTALFNWLFARQRDGVFLLRVEDTDRERSTKAHVDAILDGLRWLGLDWDGDPYYQSDGFDRHRLEVHELLESGRAYRDFASPGEEPRLEGSEDELHAVRFRVPEGITTWNDLVHGSMRFENADIEDLVLLRRDGTPTYNLAVVSDDTAMEVTYVIRGDDHLSNTPKQILLYEALGRPVPTFGHVPMILGEDGKRLSKRHGATALGSYADAGILPVAMANFLALLGWSPGDDEEVMDVEELLRKFSMERVLKKSSVFNVEKLEWLNGQHLARIPGEKLLRPVKERLPEAWSEDGGRDEAALAERNDVWLAGLIELLKTRHRSINEIAETVMVYVRDPVQMDPDAVQKHWNKDPETTVSRLEAVRSRLSEAEWDDSGLEEAIRGLAEEMEVGAGKIIHPLRVALLGRSSSPGIFQTLRFIGRERSLKRVDDALSRIRKSLLDTENRGTLG